MMIHISNLYYLFYIYIYIFIFYLSYELQLPWYMILELFFVLDNQLMEDLTKLFLTCAHLIIVVLRRRHLMVYI